MTSVSLAPSVQASYSTASAAKPGALSAPASSISQTAADPQDQLQLSPAALREAALSGRVAANVQSGNLTADQAHQIYEQIASIHKQIVADRQADGGKLSSTDAAAIQQAQDQVSQTVYSEAHPGQTAPTNVPGVAKREAIEAGRIALNEKAGNLTSTEAQQFGSQLDSIHQQIAADEQANGGSLTASESQAINQLQNALSQQIFQAARGSANPGTSNSGQ